MQRWLASICVGVLLVLGIAACQWTAQSEPSNDQSATVVEKDNRTQSPAEEEVEELTSKLASRDEETFLEAWHPELLNHIDDEAVKAKLMAPEGSVITMSGPVWSDSVGCWTADITIEVSGYDVVERTMCLVRIEGQWYITNGNEVNEK